MVLIRTTGCIAMVTTLTASLQRPSYSGSTSFQPIRHFALSFIHTFVYTVKSSSQSLHPSSTRGTMISSARIVRGFRICSLNEREGGGHTSTMTLFGLSNFTNPSPLRASQRRKTLTPAGKNLQRQQVSAWTTTITDSAVHWFFWNPLFFCVNTKNTFVTR